MDSQTPNFNELQRLLALKRHEQPPPKFFKDFSGQVMERLDDPNASRPATWNERFGLESEFRPLWLCGLGVLVCGLLAAGAIHAKKVQQDSQRRAPPALAAPPGVAPVVGADPAAPEAVQPAENRSSLEPVASGAGVPLDTLQLRRVNQTTNTIAPK